MELAPTDRRQPGVGAGRRLPSIDVVRIMAVLAVVLGHSLPTEVVKPWFFTWHVPIFFVISGYLWKPGRSLRDEWHRRSRSLLVPYACWLGIITLIFLFWRVATGRGISINLVRNILLGGWYANSPYSAYWFITALLFSSLAMRSAAMISGRAPWILACAGLAWAYLLPGNIRGVPLAAGLAIPCVLFMCLGQLTRTWEETHKRHLIAGLALLAAGVAQVIIGVRPLNIKAANFGTPLFSIIMTSCLCLGLLLTVDAASSRIPRRFDSAITTLAKCALPVVLGHSLVLLIGKNASVPWWIVVLLAILIPGIVGLLAQRWPGTARLLLGQA